MNKLDEMEAEIAKCHADRMRFTASLLVGDLEALVRYVRVAEQMYGEFYPIGHDDLAKKFIIARKALGLEP